MKVNKIILYCLMGFSLVFILLPILMIIQVIEYEKHLFIIYLLVALFIYLLTSAFVSILSECLITSNTKIRHKSDNGYSMFHPQFRWFFTWKNVISGGGYHYFDTLTESIDYIDDLIKENSRSAVKPKYYYKTK